MIKEFVKIDNKWHIIVKEKVDGRLFLVKKEYVFPDNIQKEINKILK